MSDSDRSERDASDVSPGDRPRSGDQRADQNQRRHYRSLGATTALDHTLTARVFGGLPERWQAVLWHTEVEGMDPHQVAPLIGLSPTGAAALWQRAREGLRAAWLHAQTAIAESPECVWAIDRIDGHAHIELSARDRYRLTAHLVDCTKCAIISDEVDEVGSRLALVLVPERASEK